MGCEETILSSTKAKVYLFSVVPQLRSVIRFRRLTEKG